MSVLVSVTDRPRGRPREFDPERALATIKEQFVEHGYHATTLSHLTAATGLHKGSLYAAFGDKHELFLAVLRHVSAETLAKQEEALESASEPVEGLRAYVRMQAVCVAELTARGQGCLLANTTLELLPGDETVKSVVRTHQGKVISRLATVVDLAKSSGALTSSRSSTAIARYVFAVVEGLWQIARINPDPEMLTDVAEAALDGLR